MARARTPTKHRSTVRFWMVGTRALLVRYRVLASLRAYRVRIWTWVDSS